MKSLEEAMKYVYAILTVVENNPIMQTYVSDKPMTGRQLLDEVVLTDEEKQRYRNYFTTTDKFQYIPCYYISRI